MSPTRGPSSPWRRKSGFWALGCLGRRRGSVVGRRRLGRRRRLGGRRLGRRRCRRGRRRREFGGDRWLGRRRRGCRRVGDHDRRVGARDLDAVGASRAGRTGEREQHGGCDQCRAVRHEIISSWRTRLAHDGPSPAAPGSWTRVGRLSPAARSSGARRRRRSAGWAAPAARRRRRRTGSGP